MNRNDRVETQSSAYNSKSRAYMDEAAYTRLSMNSVPLHYDHKIEPELMSEE